MHAVVVEEPMALQTGLVVLVLGHDCKCTAVEEPMVLQTGLVALDLGLDCKCIACVVEAQQGQRLVENRERLGMNFECDLSPYNLDKLLYRGPIQYMQSSGARRVVSAHAGSIFDQL
jgi:hypothetical protein